MAKIDARPRQGRQGRLRRRRGPARRAARSLAAAAAHGRGRRGTRRARRLRRGRSRGPTSRRCSEVRRLLHRPGHGDGDGGGRGERRRLRVGGPLGLPEGVRQPGRQAALGARGQGADAGAEGEPEGRVAYEPRCPTAAAPCSPEGRSPPPPAPEAVDAGAASARSDVHHADAGAAQVGAVEGGGRLHPRPGPQGAPPAGDEGVRAGLLRSISPRPTASSGEFPNFGQFFTRKLKPGLRPSTPPPTWWSRRWTARVSQAGVVEGGRLRAGQGHRLPRRQAAR